jgi:hypothetical protein
MRYEGEAWMRASRALLNIDEETATFSGRGLSQTDPTLTQGLKSGPADPESLYSSGAEGLEPPTYGFGVERD